MSTDAEKEKSLQDLLKDNTNYRNFRMYYIKEQLTEYLEWRRRNESDMLQIIGDDQKILVKLKQMLHYMCKKYEKETTGYFFLYAVPAVATLMPLSLFSLQMVYQLPMSELSTALSTSSIIQDITGDIAPCLPIIQEALEKVDLSIKKVPWHRAGLLLIGLVILLGAVCLDAYNSKKRTIRRRYYQELFDIADGITIEKKSEYIDTVDNIQQGVHLEIE